MTAAVHYFVEPADPSAHLFHVTLTVAQPAPQQTLMLPVWIPGSYLVREFSKHLQRLSARQGDLALRVTQRDKHHWQVPCDPTQPLVLQYEVYAHDTSVRSAWLDSQRGFFNGTSLCLCVLGQQDQPHTLTLTRPPACPDWQAATGLVAQAIDAAGFGRYGASSYDELVDEPIELGPFWQGRFEACGVPHRFVVAGAPPSFDGQRLLDDTQAICEAAIRFWHEDTTQTPHPRYVFLLNAVHEGYGGLEHRHSTALMCKRSDLPRLGQTVASEGYATLLGLISHEYFHTWNVKRLRPAELARCDLSRENYTELLWFFEGFTSYYDDLLLRRAHRLDDGGYLQRLGKTITQVRQTPGRQVQSVAQASFDAWVKYYRPDENTANATISYYTKGALVALCLDLSLRQHGSCLDAVMRSLWQRTGAGPMTEADVRAALHEVSGRCWDTELDAWVHGTPELPLQALLAAHGVSITPEAAPLAQRLGLKLGHEGSRLEVQTVLSGSAAAQAGFCAGDEWLAVDDWRLNQPDDVLLYARAGQPLRALVARGQRLLTLALTLPDPADTATSPWKLDVQDPAAVQRWLGAAMTA